MEGKNDILSSLHIKINEKEYTYRKIFDNYKSTNIDNLLISLDPLERYFSLIDKDNIYYFFIIPLKITIEKDNKITKPEIIYSYEQIKTMIDEKDLNNAYIKTNNNTYDRLNSLNVIILINKNIYEFTIEIKSTQNDINNNKPFLISLFQGFKPNQLTNNFYQYFKYNSQSEKDNFFNFQLSEERKEIFSYLNILKENKNLYIFKLTGPSSNGKSTTLLYYSRTQINVFYFNLSYLSKKEIEKDYKNIFNTFSEEMDRLLLSENFNKYDIEQLILNHNGNNIWNIVSALVNYLLNKKNNIIFIFDQFKSKNVEHDIYLSLLKKIKNTNIKFVICSSINDCEIKSDYRKTIFDFKGNPKFLNEITQQYYFYFVFLYKQIYIKKDKYYQLFKLFGFMQKYQYIFMNSKVDKLEKEIEEIDKKIEEKLKEFNSTSLLINLREINLYDSLVNILEILDQNIEYNKLMSYYDILPLKYFYLEFKQDYFQIHYLFEYILIFIKKKYNNIKNSLFFKNGDWLKEEVKSNIKGHYFEKSVVNSIKEKRIKFEENYDRVIKLNEICSMDFEIKDKLKEALKYIIVFDNNKIKESDINKEGEIELKKDDEKLIHEKEDKKDSNKISKIIEGRFEVVKKIIDDNYGKIEKDLEKFISDKTYKENLLDIKDFKRYINSFERIDNKRREKIIGYENNSILIEQEKINGRCIDMAMIRKNKENKNIFIGFQMKCFREDTKGGNASKISKMLIKCNYIDILMNSEQLLGIKIDEWHYIMILFYYHKSKEINEICTYLLNKCKTNKIKYIFYEPTEEKFYDNEFKEIINIYKLLDENSNLDFGGNLTEIEKNLNKSPGITFLGKKKLLSGDLIKEKKEELKSFKDFLSCKKYSFLKLRKEIENLIKSIYKITFFGKMSTLELDLLTPDIGSIFCYGGKNNNILIMIKTDENSEVKYYNLTQKKSYDIVWKFSKDLEEIDYFYMLNFEKKTIVTNNDAINDNLNNNMINNDLKGINN